VSLSRTADVAPYLGRFAEGTDDELRAIFGLAVASMRRAGRAHEVRERRHEAPPESPRVELEKQLEAMNAALAQRDAEIRKLTSALKKGTKLN